MNKIDCLNLNNISTSKSVAPIKSDRQVAVNFGNLQNNSLNTNIFPQNVTPVIRTKLTSNEQKIYSNVMSALSKSQRSQLENLLRNGTLLNSKSNDNSTVLDNLNKIITEKRADGLDPNIILSELVNTLNNPFVITQKFGDIPNKELKDIIKNPQQYKPQKNSPITNYDTNIKNVRSSACVAASIEFDLASKQPAEFARIANGLTSEKGSAIKNIKLSNISEDMIEALHLLKEFQTEYTAKGNIGISVVMKPDDNAIVRAKIQMLNKDKNERSLIDVLMQSTFMNIGSQKTYNSLTDERTGKYNPDNTGLTDIEKSFAEAISTGKNKISITYQQIDDNAMITGYEYDLATMKKHIVSALNMGENVIIGYTQQDETNKVINGHEITIVKIEKDKNGKEIFICNDTDDDSVLPVKYYVDDLLPAIHHAGLPKEILENESNMNLC